MPYYEMMLKLLPVMKSSKVTLLKSIERLRPRVSELTSGDGRRNSEMIGKISRMMRIL
jgi:hypothetical protein